MNVAEKRVLLTERAVEPWRGIFCFPGGGLDEGETPLAAARRELREEVEINIDALFPQAERTLYVGSEDGARAYRVSNFQFALQKDLPFSITAEVGHRTGWYDRERALALPIGTGTRRILRALIDSGTL